MKIFLLMMFSAILLLSPIRVLASQYNSSSYTTQSRRVSAKNDNLLCYTSSKLITGIHAGIGLMTSEESEFKKGRPRSLRMPHRTKNGRSHVRKRHGRRSLE